MRGDFQGVCFQSVAGHKTMEHFDHLHPQVRNRVRKSPFNICTICLEEMVRYGRMDWFEAISYIENRLAKGNTDDPGYSRAPSPFQESCRQGFRAVDVPSYYSPYPEYDPLVREQRYASYLAQIGVRRWSEFGAEFIRPGDARRDDARPATPSYLSLRAD